MISNNYEELKTIQKKKVYGKKYVRGRVRVNTLFFLYLLKKVLSLSLCYII